MLSPTKFRGSEAVVVAEVGPIAGGRVAGHSIEFSEVFDAVYLSRRRQFEAH